MRELIIAGGCFWGVEQLVRTLAGIQDTTVGYTGGTNANPTYEDHPGHAEAVLIQYDESQISYEQILDYFFRIHNPTTINRQGKDVGSSYRSAIFYANEDERLRAENFIQRVEESKRWSKTIVTTLEPLNEFYPAEEYHQDYLQKNPGGYTCHSIQQPSFLPS